MSGRRKAAYALIVGLAGAVLAGCGTSVEPSTVRVPQVVKQPVAICQDFDIPEVSEPDLAAPDAGIFEAARHARQQITRLRAALNAAQKQMAACQGRAADVSGAADSPGD